MESDVREIMLVLAVALIGVAIAAAVVLAPWHPAQATQAPVTGFVTNISGDD